MTIDDKIRNEKLLYSIDREAQDYQLYHLEKLMMNINILQVKTSSDQRRVIEQAMFAYSPLEKAF